jgi:hypothetical protein
MEERVAGGVSGVRDAAALTRASEAARALALEVMYLFSASR